MPGVWAVAMGAREGTAMQVTAAEVEALARELRCTGGDGIMDLPSKLDAIAKTLRGYEERRAVRTVTTGHLDLDE